MRILVLNSARKFIGEAAHCLDLVREFNRRGHEALLVVRRGYEVEERARTADIPHRCLTFSSQFSPTEDLGDLTELCRLISTWKPDIVHCHRGKDHWLAATAKLLRPWRFPPIVRTRHVVVPMAQHVANRWLMTRATARTIAVSRAAALSLGRIGEQLGPRLRIIYSPVDCEKFTPVRRSSELRRELGCNEQTLFVGLIARIQNIKGQRVFLQAAKIVASEFPQARFLIAGRGSDFRFEALRKFAASLGIDSRIVFRGWLDNLPTVLSSLDVSVIASLGSEGSSRIAYESMASGVPLVATSVGCLPEVVADRVTGLLVPPGNAEALAEAIMEVLRHRDWASTIAARALERVRSYHNYDRWIAEISEVYAEASQRKSSSEGIHG